MRRRDVQVATPHQQVGDPSLLRPFGVVDPFVRDGLSMRSEPQGSIGVGPYLHDDPQSAHRRTVDVAAFGLDPGRAPVQAWP